MRKQERIQARMIQHKRHGMLHCRHGMLTLTIGQQYKRRGAQKHGRHGPEVQLWVQLVTMPAIMCGAKKINKH